jgi:hypothetical protein
MEDGAFQGAVLRFPDGWDGRQGQREWSFRVELHAPGGAVSVS